MAFTSYKPLVTNNILILNFNTSILNVIDAYFINFNNNYIRSNIDINNAIFILSNGSEVIINPIYILDYIPSICNINKHNIKS